MRKLVLILGLLLIASAARGQLIVGGDLGGTVLFRGEESYRAPNALLSMEWQVPLDSLDKNWFGLVGYYGITDAGGPGDLAGLGGRWYFRVAEGSMYPGLGLGCFFLGPAEDDQGNVLVAKDTLLGGPEIVCEIPWGEDDKITAWCGFFGHLFGDEVNAMRFGIRAAIN